MAIPISLIVLGFQAALELGEEGRLIYRDSLRRNGAVLPPLTYTGDDAGERAYQALRGVQASLPAAVLSEFEQLKDTWNNIPDKSTPAGQRIANRLTGLASLHVADFQQSLGSNDIRNQGCYVVLVKQWGDAAEAEPWAGRLAVRLARLGLSFVANQPGAVGLEGNAARLVSSLALNLIPQLEEFQNTSQPFAEKAFMIFSQAGLSALQSNIDEMIDEDHLRDMSKSVLVPLVKAFEADSLSAIKVRDLLLGPMSEAAIGALMRNQEAFLGSKFKTSAGDPASAGSLIGELTRSVLTALQENGLIDDFGRDGALRIYNALLDLAAERPELFIDADGKIQTLGENVLEALATQLRAAPPPYNKAAIGEVVAAAVDAVGQTAPVLFDRTGDWGTLSNDLLTHLVQNVTAGLSGALRAQDGTDKVLEKLFSKDQAAALVHIAATRFAATPGMIAPDGSPELQAFMGIVAASIRDSGAPMLSAEDWLNVAALSADAVAANPGRLIDISTGNAQTDQVLYGVVSAVIAGAAGDMRNAADVAAGRRSGKILFGESLADAIHVAVKTAAGNVTKAAANTAAIRGLMAALQDYAAAHVGSFGEREMREVLRDLLPYVVQYGTVPTLTDALIESLISSDSPLPAPTDTGGVQ
ncbi:hypothetical protein [Pacificispira sp.]|uniref:hypothetical protein n=1 Tax=Pacificispira sp. TaxID=2888761 RepID=UPI003BAA957E